METCVRVLPQVLNAERGSRAQRVPQHEVLQSGVLLVFRQTLTGQNLPPLHSQLLQLLQETGPAGGGRGGLQVIYTIKI